MIYSKINYINYFCYYITNRRRKKWSLTLSVKSGTKSAENQLNLFEKITHIIATVSSDSRFEKKGHTSSFTWSQVRLRKKNMISPSRLMMLITIWFIITGCTQTPEAPDQITKTKAVLDEGATAGPRHLAETAPPVIPTPMFTPSLKLPEADQIVFTIQNSEAWSGREGDPRPDWLAWGAEIFTSTSTATSSRPLRISS
jgi:hypothetical protein